MQRYSHFIIFRPLISRAAFASVVVTVGLTVVPFQLLAQTTPAPANPQNPSTQSLQAGVATPVPAAVSAGAGAAPTVTIAPGLSTSQSSSRPRSLTSAGQGLPGMPGGPPIKGPLGYQDPASGYMRPKTIGPLLCDPLADGVCD